MNRILFGFFTMMTLALAGCSGGGSGDLAPPPEDAVDAYGRSVRGMVSDLQNNEGMQNAITNLVENMEGYETAAVGDHLDTYRQIYEGAQEMQKMSESGASSSELKAKANELAKLAESLPGGGAL